MRWISQGLVFLLMLDAGYVACGQMNKRRVWWFVCLYWVLLTLKNAADFIGGWW